MMPLLMKNLRVANCVVVNAEKSVEKCVDEFADFGGNVGPFEKFEKLGGDCEFYTISIFFFQKLRIVDLQFFYKSGDKNT